MVQVEEVSLIGIDQRDQEERLAVPVLQDRQQERFLVDHQVVLDRELQGDDPPKSPGRAGEHRQPPRRGAAIGPHGLANRFDIGIQFPAGRRRCERLADGPRLVVQGTVDIAMEAVLDRHVGVRADDEVALIRAVEQDFDLPRESTIGIIGRVPPHGLAPTAR